MKMAQLVVAGAQQNQPNERVCRPTRVTDR